MHPLFIFDLDGTLANMQHRVHLIPDWTAFFAACVHDTPIHEVIDTLQAIREGGAEVRIWSGRSDSVRAETQDWIERKVGEGVPLKMRPARDHQPDETLKLKWLKDLSEYDRARLVGIFDDRDRVVAMWRSQGVTCFQVAPGDF